MRYAFTFRNTSPDTAPVAPAHGSTGTLMRRKRRGRSHIVKAYSLHPIKRHSRTNPRHARTGNHRPESRRAPLRHTPMLTTLIRKLVRRRRRCQCVGREIQRFPIRSRDSIRRPNTPFLSNPHCSAPFNCRTFTTVFHSAASKNQPGFFKRNLGASFRTRVHRRDRQS